MRRILPALVVVAFLTSSAKGGPISSVSDNDGSKCARKCTAPHKFRYAPDTTYEFDYMALTSTSVEDAAEDSARLSIIATASVRVISPCDMMLQLRDVTVQESDPGSDNMRSAPNSATAASLLERQTLRFSFQDGVVEELCPSTDEESLPWVMNVKRGVLSAFQNSMSRLDSDETITETDVSGRCVSEYHVLTRGSSTTVRRTRDLTTCSDHHHGTTALLAEPYGTQNPVQSLPLMKSSQECEQTVNQFGVLSSATCTERHMFRPFSREASGAVTKVSQILKLKGQIRSTGDVQGVTRRVGLVYQHDANEVFNRTAKQDVEDTLRQLCRDADIRPETPRLFSSLVSAMRKMDLVDLQDVYGKLETKTLCADNVRSRKFFMDALPMGGTEHTVAMMTHLLTSNEVTGVEADMWLTSLALIQEPKEGMLQAVLALLKTTSVRDKAMLPVSSMVNNFCRRQQACSQRDAVQNIMRAFEDVVGSSCFVNKKNLDEVLLALRAIGNAGHVSRTAFLLNRCVGRSRNPMEVRVSAAQAFRRLPCDADRDAMMDIFKETQEDSEMRIAAYLAVMTCPDEVILHKVRSILETETDQQVGSFVWSHLTNLQETSSPHKQAVRQLLKKVKLPSKFDLGRLQHSRHYEGSAFLKRLDSGAGAESSVVWSSASSLPRSASANLTVDLFGRSLNLLDLGVRMEGLENLIETLLGLYGHSGDKGTAAKGSNKLDQLKGSLYMRLLGNEMTFQRFQGLKSFNSATSFNMLDFLIKLSKDHDIAMTHSLEFLDTETTVATSCGLPLTLAVRGSATMDLKARGKVDLRKVAANPRSLQIEGEIKPSGAVRVTGQMSVDAMVSRAALHVTGTLHTSTALKGHVGLERGRVLSVQLDMPEDKMDIFHVSSEFSIVHNTVEKKQEMITENRRSVQLCTGSVASRITGLELCAELQYPNASTRDSGPYFPMTGPVTMGLTLHKRDSHTGYKLMAKTVQNKRSTIAQLSFNTPGSKVNRAMAFDLSINHKDKQLEVSAASPWKKAEFKGAITATKRLMGVTGSFVTDDVNAYAVTTEVKIDESKKGVTYTPLVEVRRPGKNNITLTGTVAMETTKTASADLSLSGLTVRPLSLKTGLANTDQEVSVEGSVAHGDQAYSLRVGTQLKLPSDSKNIKLQVSPFLSVKTPRRELVAAKGSAIYNEGKLLNADVTLNLLNFKPASARITATKTGRKATNRYRGQLTVKSSLVSTNVEASASVKRGRLISGKATVSYNVPRVARDKLLLLAKMSDRSTGAYRKYSLKTSVDSKQYPDFNTAVRVNLDNKKKMSSGLLEVQYGRDPKDQTKCVRLTASASKKIKSISNVDLSYKAQALAPGQDIDIQLKGQHVHTLGMLDSSVALTYGKGKDVKAALSLKDKSGKLVKLTGSLSLQTPGSALNVTSELGQPSWRQWQHKMSVETDGGSKHSINTVYQQTKDLAHDVTTVLSTQGFKPLTLSGQANFQLKNLQLGGSAKYGKEMYAVSGAQKLVKSRNGKWEVEVVVPSRRVQVTADAGKVKGNYEASFEAAWDADKDKTAKVTFKGVTSSKVAKDSTSHKFKVIATTPLAGWDRVAAGVRVISSARQHEIITDLAVGGAKRAFSTNLVVATPFTLRHVDVAFKATTPIRGYGSLGLSFYHNVDSTALSTTLTTFVQKDNAAIRLTAKNRSTSRQSRDLEAQFTAVSTFRRTRLRSMSVAAIHKDNGRRYDNSLDAKLNGQAYSYAMSMDLDSGSNSGSVALSWPGDQSKTTWSHRLSSTDMTSTVTSIWGANKRVQLDITGHQATGAFGGTVTLLSPWAAVRDWRVTVDNQYGPGHLVSSSFVKNGHRDVFTHSFNGAIDSERAEYDIVVTSPWTHPISSKLKASYAKFPTTAEAELSWEPRKKVTAEGSLTLNSWDDLDISIRATTPVRGMRAMAAHISSKTEGTEVVGQITVDLGMRKNVAMVTRVQRDFSGARAKVTTPWDAMQVMETGFELTSGMVKADFKAVPLVLRHAAVAAWKLEDDFSVRLRGDTPRSDLPYIQIVASSKDRRDVRVSRVELEYAPNKIFSFDSAYSFTTPLMLDINVATPINGYESLSASMKHEMRDTAMDASAQLTHFNGQSVKATGTLDWSRGLDSSLTVSTPFAGWESSSATLRHEGDVTDFTSVADVTLGGQGVSGRLRFTDKINTDVQLSVTTPWAGWEKVEAGLIRKGDFTNLRAIATLLYGEHKMEAKVLNKLNSHRARFEASVTSPFTEDIKLHVQQVGGRKADATLSYGKQYSVTASGGATYTSREASAWSSVKYRLGERRRALAASLAKTGSLENLALTASASVDKQEISVTAELNTQRDVKAAVTVSTPFSGFETVSASFQNIGDLSGMTTEANIQYMNGSNINGKMELTFPGVHQLSFRGSLTSPLRGLERSLVTVSHVLSPEACRGSVSLETTVASLGSVEASYSKTGPWSDVKGEARVVFNSTPLLDAILYHEVSVSGLQSRLRVLTVTLPEIDIDLSHQGSSAGFTTTAKASVGRHEVSSETKWSQGPDSAGLAQSLFSNVRGFNHQSSFVLSRSGPLTDLTLLLAGNLNDHGANITGKLATLDDVVGSVEMQSPLEGYRSLGVQFTKKGKLDDMSVFASANKEEQRVDIVGVLNAGNDVKSSIEVTTPFRGYSTMGAAFEYGGQHASMSGHLENDMVEASGKFLNADAIEGTVNITTPFSDYRQMGASFYYATNSLIASANVENNKVEVYSSAFVNDDAVEGTVDVRTPFVGFSQMGASFNYSADSMLGSVNLENEQVAVVAALDNANNGLTASLDVSTPFTGFTHLGAQTVFSRGPNDVSITATGNVESEKGEATIKFSNDGYSMAGSADLSTPFRGFSQVGASFRHSGRADDFKTEGQVTYMDGKEIAGKASFSSNGLRLVETSAELKTPFPGWAVSTLNYRHEGRGDRLQSSAVLEAGQRYRHTADLEVDLSQGQEVQLTVTTPYPWFARTEITHSLSTSNTGTQWSGKVAYGPGQFVASQLTTVTRGDQFTSQLHGQMSFFDNFTFFSEYQRDKNSVSIKQIFKDDNHSHLSQHLQLVLNDPSFWMLTMSLNYTANSVSQNRYLSLRRDGPWNDVNLSGKAAVNGEEAVVEASFKKSSGKLDGKIQLNTPFEGYRDVGASFRHSGDLPNSFNTQAWVEYSDEKEVAAMLDFQGATWRQLEVTTQLTTPFEGWKRTQVEYRHSGDNEGFTGHAGVEYNDNQHVTGDLRVTPSPHMDVMLTVNTLITSWERVSVSGGYQDDGWATKEMFSKLDLGHGFVYAFSSALTLPSDNSAMSLTAQLTTPHADWHTLETRLSHEGGASDFKSSAFLSIPIMDTVSASTSLRYNSPFDLSATAALDTPFTYLKGVKMEVVNEERGIEKTSHVVFGWSRDKEIVVDSTWRHDNTWYERRLHADISLTSPLGPVRSATWVFEHQASSDQYEQKVTGVVNGNNLIGLDLTTINGDLPGVTLTLTEPRTMQYSLSRTRDGAEVTLNWDRDDPHSNLRLTSRFTDSSDDVTTQHDLELKATHPIHTVGGRYNLHSTPTALASQGEVYWGTGGNRRLSYALDLNDRSRRASTIYEGTVKVGVLSRAVQLSGAVSRSPSSRLVDAALQWDADRDRSKQVAVKTRWTSGDKNTADVTLSLPAINQELRVQSAVSVNQGRTLLDAMTALSYSPDPSKAVTLTSTLTDNSDLWRSGSNYSLHLALTHPDTDLDLAFTSHLAASPDHRYSAAVDSWYLTSRRERKNMALRGEIDQLRRQISMEMVSPMKKVSVKGEVKSLEPYSVSLTNRYDEDRVIQADVTVDTEKRAFSFKTNYDLDHPERTLAVEAYYVNDTAISASVYRDHVTEVITDALVALRLNTSTLLHSRLHWRSASLGELKDYAEIKLGHYTSRSTDTVHSLSQAMHDELTARYAITSTALNRDLSPFAQHIDQEVVALGNQVAELHRTIRGAYRNCPYLRYAGDAVSESVLVLRHHLDQLSRTYMRKVDQVRQLITRYPVGHKYRETVSQLLHSLEELADGGVAHLKEAVASLEFHLLAAYRSGVYVSDYLTETAHRIATHPRVQYIKNSLDFAQYIHTAAAKLSRVRMPKKLSAALDRASLRVQKAVSDVMDMAALKQVKMASNEVYQQGVWAYNYWQVEDNLKKTLDNAFTLIQEIIQEEMEVYTRPFRFLPKSNFTVWDPDHGEVQAELYLPVAMETLQSVPDVTPLVEEYNDAIDKMVPDAETMQYFYDQLMSMKRWWNNSTRSETGELMAELKEFTPARRPRKLRKMKKNKRHHFAAAI